jgi:hypothetical protein
MGMRKLTIILLISSAVLALNPEQSAKHEDATLYWRENHCEGYGPGDCSVRQPGTAHVRVELPSKTVRILVRCKATGCVADAQEIAEWVDRARKLL